MKKVLFLILICLSLVLTGFSLPGCASRDAGIWRSDDRGENWSQKVKIDEKKNLASLNVLRIIFDPVNSEKIYLGSQGKGLYISEDKGETWQPTQINKGDVWDVAIDSENPNIFYVAVFSSELGRVYKTEDSGENWELIFIDTIVGTPIYNVIIDWYDRNQLILSTGWGGIIRSSDQGKTWEKLAELSAPAGRIHVSDTDSRTMWYVTPSQGIFRTTDGGSAWEEIALDSLEEYEGASQIHALEIDRNNGVFYLATNYGLLTSNDQGQSWEPLKTLTPFGALPFYGVAVNPQDVNEIFFTTGNTVFKSVNQGESWSSRKVYTGQAVRYIEYHPQKPEIIYLGIRQIK